MTKRLFYDVETTGLDHKTCAIHQLAYAIEINGQIKNYGNVNIQPHQTAVISQEALDVAGVTEQQIKSEPYQLSNEVFSSFKETLSRFVDPYDKTDKIHLIGYNNRGFDDNFLRSWFELNGDKYFGSWFWSDSHDVMVLASSFLEKQRHKMPNFKLATVAKEMGITVKEDQLHDAMYDIKLTIMIYKRFMAQLHGD